MRSPYWGVDVQDLMRAEERLACRECATCQVQCRGPRFQVCLSLAVEEVVGAVGEQIVLDTNGRLVGDVMGWLHGDLAASD